MNETLSKIKEAEVGDVIDILTTQAIVLGENIVAIKYTNGMYALSVFGTTSTGKPITLSLDKALLNNVKKYL